MGGGNGATCEPQYVVAPHACRISPRALTCARGTSAAAFPARRFLTALLALVVGGAVAHALNDEDGSFWSLPSKKEDAVANDDDDDDEYEYVYEDEEE